MAGTSHALHLYTQPLKPSASCCATMALLITPVSLHDMARSAHTEEQHPVLTSVGCQRAMGPNWPGREHAGPTVPPLANTASRHHLLALSKHWLSPQEASPLLQQRA